MGESDPPRFALPANDSRRIPHPQKRNFVADKSYWFAYRPDPLSFLIDSAHTLALKRTLHDQVVDVTY